MSTTEWIRKLFIQHVKGTLKHFIACGRPLSKAKDTDQLSSCGVLLWLCQSHQMIQLSCLPACKINVSCIPQEGAGCTGIPVFKCIGIPVSKCTERTRAAVSFFSLLWFVLCPGCIFQHGVICPVSGRHQPLHGHFVQEIQHPPDINDLRLLPASVIVVVSKPFVAAPPLKNSNNNNKK